MGKTVVRTILVVLALVGASLAMSVSISSPANNSTISSPATIAASASSSYPITGWHIYVDGVDRYAAAGVRSISAAVSMSTGTHQVIVRAWDSTGAYSSSNLIVTVAGSAAAVSINVSSPSNGATVTSPATITASAASAAPITGWHIYVDGRDSYAAGATSNIAAPVSLSAGTHQVVVRAWNSAGAYGSANLTLAVGGGTPAPVPPANATTYGSLDQKGGWTTCSSGSCSGGIAPASSYWMAQNQTSPSLDGSSTQFFMVGPAYSTALWAVKAGTNATPAHYIFDFQVFVDTVSAVEALEFDFYHVANSNKYMFGTECNYWTKTWDVWNEVTQRWIHSNATCNPFAANTWHRVQWALERVGNQIHYLSVTVDGVTQSISDAYAWQPAQYTWWGNGDMGIQIQLDISSAPGAGIHEWLDKANVYAW